MYFDSDVILNIIIKKMLQHCVQVKVWILMKGWLNTVTYHVTFGIIFCSVIGPNKNLDI